MARAGFRFVDSHCHLDFEAFADELPAHLGRCFQAGIEHIVIPGVKKSQWSRLANLADAFRGAANLPKLHVSLGLHPYFLDEHSDSDIDVLADLISRAGVNMVGEIGLDAAKPDMDRQLSLFESQLSIASSNGLPVILHSYKTHSTVLSRLKRYQIETGVVHAYSGSYQDAMQFIEQGMKIGVGGVITWPRAKKTRETVAKIPLECIVLETDAPDSPVMGKKKGEGHPIDLVSIFAELCALRNESDQRIADAVFDNSRFLI